MRILYTLYIPEGGPTDDDYNDDNDESITTTGNMDATQSSNVIYHQDIIKFSLKLANNINCAKSLKLL